MNNIIWEVGRTSSTIFGFYNLHEFMHLYRRNFSRGDNEILYKKFNSELREQVNVLTNVTATMIRHNFEKMEPND